MSICLGIRWQKFKHMVKLVLIRVMTRYPAPLSEKEWNYLLIRLNEPQTEEHKRKISEMAENGRKIKIHV